MTDIQKARDVLDKWRKDATQGQWRLGDSYSEYADIIQDTATMSLVASYVAPENMRFIVGTAGNPDLLDAIDMQLRLAIRNPNEVYDETVMRVHEALASPLAAAIVAADKRMQQ